MRFEIGIGVHQRHHAEAWSWTWGDLIKADRGRLVLDREDTTRVARHKQKQQKIQGRARQNRECHDGRPLFWFGRHPKQPTHPSQEGSIGHSKGAAACPALLQLA